MRKTALIRGTNLLRSGSKAVAMATIRLRYVTRDRDRHGNIRYYYRRRGKQKVRLPGLPGSAEFMEAYKGALANDGADGAKREKTLEWLCDRYCKSAYFGSLELSTRRRKRSVLDEICQIGFGEGKAARKLGSLPYSGMTRASVRKLRDMRADSPEMANFRLKQISALFSWAVKNELAKSNPAAGVEKIANTSSGYYTWTESDVEQFERYWPVGSRPRLAFAIMLYLGVRRSDAVRLGPKHTDDDSVSFVQHKGRKRSQKVLTLPILPPLRAVLDTSQSGGETWLETLHRKPYSDAGFGNAFKDWCREAGLPQCTAHGLRKIGAVRAAEAKATEHELMAILGWENADMAREYTRSAAQKRLAKNAAGKLMGAKDRQIVVPPAVPSEKNLKHMNGLKKKWLPGPDSNQRPSG